MNTSYQPTTDSSTATAGEVLSQQRSDSTY
jgi:hypothetical protein